MDSQGSGDDRELDGGRGTLLRAFLFDLTTNLSCKRGDQPSTRSLRSGWVNTPAIVGDDQPSLLHTHTRHEPNRDCPSFRAEGMFGAVGDGLIHDQPHGNSPVNQKLDLIRLNLDGNVLKLLLDVGAQRPEVGRKIDQPRTLAKLLRGIKLIMGQRDGVDAVRNVIKNPSCRLLIDAPSL
jgi:hypothetical protein